jgi:hypothetical protein
MNRATCFVCLTALAAAFVQAAPAPPSAGVWNIATTGKAASSGDLEFRITSTDGSDPVEITVPVIAGSSQDAVARSIRRALSSQLPHDRYDVQLGEGGNVQVSDPRGRPNFTLELLASDIDNVRVAVQNVTPAAAPTVPTQAAPAEVPAAPAPGNAAPGDALPPGTPAPPSAPAPSGTTPPPNAIPSPGPNAPAPGNTAPAPGGAPGPATTAPGPAPTVPGPAPKVPGPAPSAPPGPPGNSSGGAGAPADAPPPRGS